MNNNALAERLGEQLGRTASEAGEYINIMLEQMKERLQLGEEVRIAGFGKWAVKSKRLKIGHQLETGAHFGRDARAAVSFHAAENFCRMVSEGSAGGSADDSSCHHANN